MAGLSTFDMFKNTSSSICQALDQIQLVRLQNTLLEMLDDIITVCNTERIDYMLGGGSALGAARHQGIIPWDDDIDVNMTRKEVQRFLPAFKRAFSEKYWIHTPEEYNNYALLMIQIRKKGTCLKTRDDFWHEECGACIDIFVIENTFDCKPLRIVHGMGSLAFGLLLSCRKFYRDRKQLLEFAQGNREIVSVLNKKIAIGFLISFLPINMLTRMANGWNKMCKNDHSRYVTIPSGRKHFFGEMGLREDVASTRECVFSKRNCRCPANLEEYLSRLYGDYMKIPEEHDIEKHYYFGEIKI